MCTQHLGLVQYGCDVREPVCGNEGGSEGFYIAQVVVQEDLPSICQLMLAGALLGLLLH